MILNVESPMLFDTHTLQRFGFLLFLFSVSDFIICDYDYMYNFEIMKEYARLSEFQNN